MALEKGKLMEVGVGWEKVTEKTGPDGKVHKNRWLSLRFNVPIMANESVMCFRQSEEKMRERFKRELTDKDPRWTIMRSVYPST